MAKTKQFSIKNLRVTSTRPSQKNYTDNEKNFIPKKKHLKLCNLLCIALFITIIYKPCILYKLKFSVPSSHYNKQNVTDRKIISLQNTTH